MSHEYTELIIKHGVSILMSVITLWMMFWAGNKHPKAWLVGIFNQALWLGWIIYTESWGLIPMNIGMWVICLRNHIKWKSEQ